MTASFNLTLDTHAPVVTWGDPADANSGEEMSIPYALDEPSLTRAELALSDGRVLDMTALGGVLSVELPDDADGQAEVRAYVEDDVGNAAVRLLEIGLNGTVVAPPPPTVSSVSPGWGGRPQPKPVLVTGRSSAVCGSRTRVRVGVASSARLRARSRYVAPSQRTVRQPSRASVASTARLAVAASPPAVNAVGTSRVALWKRPEGPSAEEDLILLGLL